MLKNADRLISRLRKPMLDIMPGVEKACVAAYEAASELAPVMSGELKGSITYDITSNEDTVEGRVYSTAEHAVYVEFGTSRMPAQPFLTPAAEIAKDAFMSAMKEAIK